MKTKTLIATIVGIIAAGICVSAYNLGLARGRHMVDTLNLGTFVTELAVLQELRRTNTEFAIERLEAHLYATATMAMDSRSQLHRDAFETFRPELVAYRQRYAVTKSSPVETNLAARLSKEAESD